MKIGIIPDGNRKYAQTSNISLTESYIQGAQIALKIVEAALKRGNIDTIVFYILSKENFTLRTNEEVQAILKGSATGIKLIKNLENVSLHYVGDIALELSEIVSLCDGGHGLAKLKIYFLCNYNPDWDFQKLPIRSSAIGNLDLIIRTGESRLSGFLPLQSSNAQLYFPKCYWEEFSVEQFDSIIEDFLTNFQKRVSGK